MNLLLTGTRDHALLAMVVQEAYKLVKDCNGYVGRTALQKILYFLKVLGVPMSYRFDIYHYGPFCEEILRDVQWLIVDNVIKDCSHAPHQYSNYAPDEVLEELLDQHREAIEPYRKRIRQIVNVLVPMEPKRLELIATLDFLYRMEKASGLRGPWKRTVIARFQEIKKDKFSTGEIDSAYDLMVRAGLLEP